jgi:hypothetical protein
VIVVMAAVWPIGLWCRGDGGGTVKKESKKEVETIANNYPRQNSVCLLHFDSSRRVCLLYKFLYAFKVVKHFLKHPVYKMQHLEDSGTPVLYIGLTVLKG